eukprot:scpid107835/ scgid20364/ 
MLQSRSGAARPCCPCKSCSCAQAGRCCGNCYPGRGGKCTNFGHIDLQNTVVDVGGDAAGAVSVSDAPPDAPPGWVPRRGVVGCASGSGPQSSRDGTSGDTQVS